MKTRSLTIRVLIAASMVVIAGGVLTAFEHRILHGYWRRPVSLVGTMKADRVEAVTTLVEADRGELAPARGTVSLPEICGVSGLRSCVEGQTLLDLFGTDALPSNVSDEIAPALWIPLWAAVRAHSDWEYRPRLGSPAAGTMIQFVSGDRRYGWVGYSTHEREDDWHDAVQLLYDLSGNRPELVRSSSFRYEIAGLEGIPLWLAWAVNALLVAIPYAVSIADEYAASRRWYRIMKTILMGLLLVTGSALALLALYIAHGHDPWIVVFFILATLMVASGLYISVRRRPTPVP